MIKRLAVLLTLAVLPLVGCSGSKEEAKEKEPRIVEVSEDDLPYRLEFWDFNRDDRVDGIKVKSKVTSDAPTERDSAFKWLTEEYRGKVKGDLEGYTTDLDYIFADAATLALIHNGGTMAQAKNRLKYESGSRFRPSR